MRKDVQLRTLSNLKQHFTDFQASGSDPNQAKNCFNVIDEIHFDIPLDQVKGYYIVTLFYLANLECGGTTGVMQT